jgi:hypothetical protein
MRQFSLTTANSIGKNSKYQEALKGKAAIEIEARTTAIPAKVTMKHRPGLEPLGKPKAASVNRGNRNAIRKYEAKEHSAIHCSQEISLASPAFARHNSSELSPTHDANAFQVTFT